MKTGFITLACLLFLTSALGQSNIKILSYSQSDKQPGFYNAVYTSGKNTEFRSRNVISLDNGKTWETQPTTTKKISPPPRYGRRVPVASIFDQNNNHFITFLNALDNPNIPKNIAEPRGALNNYYLRYRVSDDYGKSWLYDKPLIGDGNFSAQNPFPDISIGKNAFYLGDYGSKPIITKDGTVLLPVQTTIMATTKNTMRSNNILFNPTGAFSYTDVLILKGEWHNSDLKWNIASRIKGDPNRTTRGLIEPTMIQFDNGKILIIMRGSNGGKSDPNFILPSYKWYSYSTNNGNSWTEPRPWTYDNGSPFFSPSSMSVLLKHSSGRCFWIGNITPSNPHGGLPRYPLVMGEVNQKNMQLIKSSVITLDTYKDEDKGKGELDLGHVTAIEDKMDNTIIIVYPRILGKSAKRSWVQIRVKV